MTATDEQKSPVDEVQNAVQDFTLLQRTFILRISDHVRDVARQMSTGAIDPAAWVNIYSTFWSSVIEDVGDWWVGWRPALGPDDERLSVRSDRVTRQDRTTAIPFTVPREAFVDATGREHSTIRLLTDGLKSDPPEPLTTENEPSDAGTPKEPVRLPLDRVVLWPNPVSQREPHGNFKVFDLYGRGVPGTLYRAFVWAKETGKPVALIQLTVDFDFPQPSDDKSASASRMSRVPNPSANQA